MLVRIEFAMDFRTLWAVICLVKSDLARAGAFLVMLDRRKVINRKYHVLE